MKQDYDNGKYTVIFNERTGALHALRNGEVWKDLSGNNLVYWMLVEHKRALERIAELEQDAARLDWMQENFICADFRYGEPATEVIAIEMPRGARVCGDLRVDIDAAMKGA